MKDKIKRKLRRFIKNEALVSFSASFLYFFACACYFFKNLFSKRRLLEDGEEIYLKTDIESKVNLSTETNCDLSVIIPVYNGKQFIVECLDSVLTQNTQFSFEVILVDDGSKDGLEDYIAENGYLDKIKYLRIENSGQGYARNRGIELSSGRRLMFLDADDKMADGCIQTMLEYNEDLVQCGFEEFGESNRRVIHKQVYTKNQQDILRLKCFSEGYPWGKVYDRSLFLEDGFPEKIHFEDNNLNFFILPQLQSYRYIDKPLILYRIHCAQETANVNKNRIGCEQVDVVSYLYLKAEARYKSDRTAIRFLNDALIFNLTGVLYSRIKGDVQLSGQALKLITEFFNKYCAEYRVETYKEKQLFKAIKERDINKFINVCKYL